MNEEREPTATKVFMFGFLWIAAEIPLIKIFLPKNKAIEDNLRKTFKESVFNTKIRENISIAEAPTSFQDVATYAPTSHGAEDYKALTDEILKRTK